MSSQNAGGRGKCTQATEIAEKVPPRQRILAAATELFYQHGIRAVGVEAIAEAAETNKMTLYRHFSSKDELVAEYMRELFSDKNDGGSNSKRPSRRSAGATDGLAAAGCRTRDDPKSRGCAIANAASNWPKRITLPAR